MFGVSLGMIGQPAPRRPSTGSLLLYPAYVQDFLDRMTAADVAAGDTGGLERGVTDLFSQVLQDLVADTTLAVSNNLISVDLSRSKCMVFLCGARTLNGCLTPVVGAVPTNFNFTGPRYDRRFGLLGDGATTYIRTNRSNSSGPQNSKHLAVYKTQNATQNGGLFGTFPLVEDGASWIYDAGAGGAAQDTYRVHANPSVSLGSADSYPATGFIGVQRIAATTTQRFYSGALTTDPSNSQLPSASSLDVFRAANAYTDARQSFYSTGSGSGGGFTLESLGARVTALMNGLAALSL
jgi:hypothetical protein